MPNILSALTIKQLDEHLAKAKAENLCLVIDFWATWCGPCRMMTPYFVQLAEMYESKCLFVKIDVDRAEEVTTKYGIQAMPTFIIFKGDTKAEELVGASKEKLESMIKRHVDALLQPSEASESSGGVAAAEQ